MPRQRRNRRAGVEDLWYYSGKPKTTEFRTARYGRGKRWRARFVHPDGNEVSQAHETKLEAQRWLDAQTTAIGTNSYIDPHARCTVEEAAERAATGWGRLAEKTRYNKESLLNSRVLPKWAHREIRTIRPSEVDAWISELVAEELSTSLIDKCVGMLRQILDLAVDDRLLSSNPAVGRKTPREQTSHKAVYLNAKQLISVSQNCHGYETLILVLGACGLRFGEATALLARDIDLRSHRISITKAYSGSKGRIKLGPTKTGKSRWVPIPELVEEQLRGLISLRGDDDLLFTASRGGPLRNRNFYERHWSPAVAATPSVPNGTWLYDLRHTAASLAIHAGANIKAVQHILGHRSATLVLDRYGHLYEDDLGGIATRVNGVLRAA